MAVDPNTGRIITSSSLTIAEADEKRVPRNQALGPSRTADERKQIRTAMMSQWDGLGDNPIIQNITDELEILNSKESSILFSNSGNIGQTVSMPAITITRVEDNVGDPYYYLIEGVIWFEISNSSADPDLFVMEFLGTAEYNILVDVRMSDDAYLFGGIIGTGVSDSFTLNSTSTFPSTIQGVCRISGKIVPLSTTGIVIKLQGATGTTFSINNASYIKTQLSDSVFT